MQWIWLSKNCDRERDCSFKKMNSTCWGILHIYLYNKKKKEGINHKRRETEMISMHIQGTPKEETSMCSAVICVSVWVYEIKKLVWMG